MHLLSPSFWSTASSSEATRKSKPEEPPTILHINVPTLDQKQLDHERKQQQAPPLSGNRMNRNLRVSKPSGLSLPAGSPEYLSPSIKSSRAASGMSDFYRQQQYLARAIALDQMDLQAALDQMRTILSLSPARVYKTSYYRKQTKNHWARDDPAFAVLEIAFLAVASIAYCVAFKRPSLILAILKFMVQHILGVWLGLGIVITSLGQFVANHYLSLHGNNNNNGTTTPRESDVRSSTGGLSSHHVKQGVEWLYAFDIHCNAFLPLFVVVYATQFFLLPLVLGKSIFALIVANTLYAIGFSWYFYIMHLGYRALPFLGSTEVFLFPIVAVLLLYVLNIVGYPFGFGYNASRIMAHLSFD